MNQEFAIKRFFYLACLAFSFQVRADILDNWTTNQISTNSSGLFHIVYGNSIYVAVASSDDIGAFYTSTDGFHWVLQYTEDNSYGLTLNYSSGHFACAGPALGDGVTDVSADGTNWTTTLFGLYPFPYPSPVTATAITYGRGLYVMVGASNNVASIETSPDGGGWTSQTIPSPGGPLNGIAFGNGVFVAIGDNDGSVYVSSTGTGTWSKYSLAGGSKVSFAHGKFFVPLNNTTNLLSANGSVWGLQATGLTNMLGSVTYVHGVYMAQAGFSTYTSGSYLATSADGTNWFQYPTRLPNSWPISGDSNLDVLSVASDGTRLVTSSSFVTNLYLYNSFIYVSDPLVFISQTNNPSRGIALSGLVGRNYQIQSIDALGGSSWQTKMTFQMTNTPIIWTDSTATNSARFYRGALLP